MLISKKGLWYHCDVRHDCVIPDFRSSRMCLMRRGEVVVSELPRASSRIADCSRGFEELVRACKSCKSRVVAKRTLTQFSPQLMCLLTRSTWPASCGPGNSWSICPSYFPLGNSCIEQEQKQEPKSLIHKACNGRVAVGHVTGSLLCV